MSSPTGTIVTPQLKPARSFPNANVAHAIRFSCRQGATPAGEDAIPPLALNTQIHIGTIPKGSVITSVHLHVRTLFDGTTPLFIIGTIADDDGILTGATSAVATAGIKPGLSAGAVQLGYAPGEMPLYVKLTAAGNTAGELHAIIPFYPAKT